MLCAFDTAVLELRCIVLPDNPLNMGLRPAQYPDRFPQRSFYRHLQAKLPGRSSMPPTLPPDDTLAPTGTARNKRQQKCEHRAIRNAHNAFACTARGGAVLELSRSLAVLGPQESM